MLYDTLLLSETIKFDEEEVKPRNPPTIEHDRASQSSLDRASTVVLPVNLFPGLETYWEVTKKDGSHIDCILGVRPKHNSTSTATQLRPRDILFGLPNALLLDACPHDPQAALEQPDRHASYCDIFPAHRDASSPTSHVEILPVDVADDLRSVAVRFAMYRQPRYYVLRGKNA